MQVLAKGIISKQLLVNIHRLVDGLVGWFINTVILIVNRLNSKHVKRKTQFR